MKLRMTALAAVLTALLAFFGVRAMSVGRGVDDERSPTAPSRSTGASQVAALESQARDKPTDGGVLTTLASAYMQRARETGDPSYYTLADTASKRALALSPEDVGALVVAGGIAASRHDFAGALALAEQARAVEPSFVATYGVLTDAFVELGRYDEAIDAAQEMADRHPDFASYSRISYIRELHGDVDGAIAAMQQAVAAGSSVAQDVVWGRVLLGSLYLAKGDVDAAALQYGQAATLVPGDPTAEFGLAKLALARGDDTAAEQHLRAAIDKRPLPEYIIAYGDLLATQGRTQETEQEYATVRAIEQLFAANGVDTDIELALFDADHDVEPEKTYEVALAAYQRRRSVYAADAVAWAAYKAGHLDDARVYMARAQYLGTRDSRLAFHAGVIARASGDDTSAQRYLADALAARTLSPRDREIARAVIGTFWAVKKRSISWDS